MSNTTKKYLQNKARGAFDVTVHSCGFDTISAWDHENVTYPDWLFYWNPTPGGSLFLNGREKELISEEALMIPPYTTFTSKCLHPFRHFYLHFAAPAPFDRVKREFFSFPAAHAREMVRRIQKTEEKNALALLFRLLIYEYLLKIPQEAFLPENEAVLDARIKRAIELMEADFASPQDNQRTARRIGMSLNNFYRLFVAETGTTPKHYLRNLRMEHARRLLVHSDQTIDEIAAGSGYADRYHFSKAFRKFYALSPAAYRKTFRSVRVP